MPFVELSRVSFAYTDSIEVISEVSFELHAGWTGVVGENGGGKSTLLRLLAGQLTPTRGRITHAGDPTSHLCAQRVDHLSSDIRALAGSWTRAAMRLMSRLELDPDDLDRWQTLSPGERKRWQIAAALSARPDVLLLDEPTNHVDARARELLLGALSRFRGIGLVVSHDRGLLDALTTRTVRVHHGRALLYRGAYDAARATWCAEAERTRRAHATARKRETAVKRRLADERRKRASAEARTSTRKRMKGRNDSDARSMAAKARASNGEVRLSRKVGVLKREAERASAKVATHRVERERGRALFIDYQPAPRPYVTAVELDVLRAGTKVLARDVRAAVAREGRIHIAGHNGAGKTTLMNALIAASTVAPERLLHVPQTISRERTDALLDELHRTERGERGRILQVAAALGLDPDRVLATSAPSPGEIRKLTIAWGLGVGAWALFLDEPTNHLDLPSIERVERALAAYPGALVIVSHDEAFARTVTTTTWRLDDQRVHIV